MTQRATVKPTTPMAWTSPYTNLLISRAATSATANITPSWRAAGPIWLRFQLECMPIPSSSSNGTMGIRKATPKYGGPTEILPSPSASRNSG